MRLSLIAIAAFAAAPLATRALPAQVVVQPSAVTAGAITRYALQVANLRDVAVAQVRLDLPQALTVLGVDAPAGWTSRFIPATDSSPPAIEWSGATLAPHALHEFAFLARLTAAAQRHQLVFPVRLQGTDGGVTTWGSGGSAAAPVVEIAGGVGVTSGGAFALAAGAFGVALLAIGLAAVKRAR
ncbi:MAG TPA: DUF1775 domain-containing protein [Gemmatimonadales bacterium]